ncbi:cell division protein ZapA [Galenea microaerophila]
MLTLTLMNHTFEIPCKEEDKPRLIEAATLLEEKLEQMPHLRGESKVLMVALNLCYDYLQMKNETLQYCLHLDQQMEETLNALPTEEKSL